MWTSTSTPFPTWGTTVDEIDVRWLVFTAIAIFLIGAGSRIATWIVLTRKRGDRHG